MQMPQGMTWQTILPIAVFVVAMGALFWWTVVRPEKGRSRQHMELVANLKPGDKVVTAGGLHGTIVTVRERTVEIEVTSKVVLTFDKYAVRKKQ
jgi:preprotein translocase subunit YajC